MALADRRIPLGARIFILTLAVVDDVGGIIVIAVFYADSVRPGWLLVSAVSVAVTLACQRDEVRSLIPYLVLGAVCWLGLHEAGVEAAIVGVVYGLLTPVRAFHPQREFGPTARLLVDRIEATFADGVLTADERDRNELALEDLARFATETSSPLERLELRLGLWVSLLIVPVFAFANAGVHVDTSALDERVILASSSRAGLSWVRRSACSRSPSARCGSGRAHCRGGMTMRHLAGLAVTAGIGFTVALYVTGLSFDDAALTSSAKVGVLAASVVAGVAGFAVLRTAPAPVELPRRSVDPSRSVGEMPAAMRLPLDA